MESATSAEQDFGGTLSEGGAHSCGHGPIDLRPIVYRI